MTISLQLLPTEKMFVLANLIVGVVDENNNWVGLITSNLQFALHKVFHVHS